MRRTLAVLVILASSQWTPVAFGHKTGAEAKSADDCKKLQPPTRGHCLECVSRARPHHFHPDLPQGQQCKADEGAAK